jgi:hypothetical protein
VEVGRFSFVTVQRVGMSGGVIIVDGRVVIVGRVKGNTFISVAVM